ncbi:hypothetical protein O0L34_g19294 [Tuta absoluta]|nr:hypothetical protein O0L34_g19292 [Tuta absoluta]KAJ2937181.1 hypothetical protein O0L34_g19294 [Tuta absoluta]
MRWCCGKKLFYDIRSDEVIGFHNIDGEKSEEIASHAFVIMLRGCVENYKQPLGYALTATTKNYLDLNRWVDQTILQLFAVGFIVCAVVSNQGSNFINLARSKGVTTDKPYFIIDGKKVFYFFDVPHLFKSIRNNMLTYNLQYKENKVACWSHVESFYGRDKERRMAPKLTDAHLKPNRL